MIPGCRLGNHTRLIRLVKKWIQIGRTCCHARRATHMTTALCFPLSARAILLVTTAAWSTKIKHGSWLHIDFFLGELFNVRNMTTVMVSHQGHSQSRCSCTTCTTNTVHIVFGVERHVVVEDCRHVLDIQTTRGHVGANQQIDFAGLEGFQCLQSLVLALVVMGSCR